MSKKTAILWFRNDLRLHDNEALTNALNQADQVLPVYLFDPRLWHGTLPLTGYRKMGPYRARFLLESLANLRDNLRQYGSDLLFRIGLPEEVLPDLCQQTGANWVYCNRERMREELEAQNAVEQALWPIGREMLYSRGKLLYYTADLPFPITQTPDVFIQFRKETERITPVRAPLPTPNKIPTPTKVGINFGQLPELSDFDLTAAGPDDRAAIQQTGGETAGLDRLAYYLFESHAVDTYKATRTGLIGPDFSTKFSAWLAHGCLSPKLIYRELKAYEEKNGANESTYGVYFELLRRDFFRLLGKKHGEAIFQRGGIKGEAQDWRQDRSTLERWVAGQTGTPFIDANMTELTRTGYLSNLGRQNVASYLAKDLQLDWRMGAEYFEHILTDYDVTSNWGNWMYVAGVGTDPREDRYLNILSQAQRHDPAGEYVRRWLPALAGLPAPAIHQPDTLDEVQRHEFGPGLAAYYSAPLVASEKWLKKKRESPGARRRARRR